MNLRSLQQRISAGCITVIGQSLEPGQKIFVSLEAILEGNGKTKSIFGLDDLRMIPQRFCQISTGSCLIAVRRSRRNA